jgi:hypothetical protein
MSHMDDNTRRCEIRADHDASTIVVYQAYRKEIALAALAAGRFVSPFSLNRMTWIKPSFLWMMHRSNWGQKSGQEYILAVRITRAGWEAALAQAVLTAPEQGVYRGAAEWRISSTAPVLVQWDPERSLRGAALQYDSIQVGLGRHIIARYVDEWTTEIHDYTPLVRKIHSLLRAGEASKAAKLLPAERVYPTPEAIARRLGMR